MNLEVPDWAIRLVPANGEPIRISDEDYLKLKAYLPKKPATHITLNRMQSEQESYARYNKVREQLWMLIEFNHLVREKEAASRQATLRTSPLTNAEDPQAKRHEGASSQVAARTAPPTTVDEALAQGYVECKVIHALFPNRFGNAPKLTYYLDDPKRKDLIRQLKPQLNRRLVCAADFLNVLFQEQELDEAARSRVDGGSPPRRNRPMK